MAGNIIDSTPGDPKGLVRGGEHPSRSRGMITDPVSSSKVKVAAWEAEPRRIDPGKNRRFERDTILSRFSPRRSFSLSFGESIGCETDISLGVNELACLREGTGGTGPRARWNGRCFFRDLGDPVIVSTPKQ